MTRQEAIDELHKHYVPEYVNYIVTALTDGATPSDAPTINAKTGHWVKKSQYGNDYCSKCDYELLMRGKPKYCPNCGSKMVELK